jgi:hypothetical protein
MSNSKLQNRIFKLPDNVFNYIHGVITSLKDKSVVGVQRAKGLIKTRNVSYSQLKSIIYDLKKPELKDSIQFKLMGGDLMLQWGETHLNGERTLIKNNKNSQKRANEIGQLNDIRQNSFLKKHTKKTSSRVPTNMLKSNSDKTSVSPISSLGIFEEVERIKGLL